MTYYYKDTAGHEVGPVSEDEIHAFRAGGLLVDETLVRATDSADWISYAARFGRLPVASAGTTAGTKFTRKQFFAIGLAAAVVAIIFCGSVFIKQQHTLSFALSLDGKGILPPKTPNISVDGERFSTGSRISTGRHLLVVQLEGAKQIERQFWVIFGAKDLGTLALETSQGSLAVTATPLAADAKRVANEHLQEDSERYAKYKEDEILRKKDFIENEFAKSWYADVDGAFAIFEIFGEATYNLSLNVNDTKARLRGITLGTPEQGSTQINARIDRLRRSEIAQQLGWSQVDLSSLNKFSDGGGLAWEIHLARPDWKRKHGAVSWANEGIGNSGRLFSLSSNIAVMAESQLTHDAGVMYDRLIVPDQLATNLQRFYKLESSTGIHLDDVRQNQVGRATESTYLTVPFSFTVKGSYSAILNFMLGLENQHGWIVQIRNFSIEEIPTATPATAATPYVSDTPPKAGSRTDAEILHAIANGLKPTGNFIIGGKQTLIFGNKRVLAGMPMTIAYYGIEYTLEMIAIDRTSFTLRLNREEVTRPIKSP